MYRKHKDGDLLTKRVRKMGIPCQGGIDSDGRLSSAVRGLFSLMLLSSSKGGPAASGCLSSVLFCLRLHDVIPKDVVVTMKNAVASISHQPVHATLAMLLQFSSTWDPKCTKSVQSLVNTLASLDRDMRVCVLAEYVHNSIRATLQRTVLESMNDDGVSFSSALCSRAATFSRVYTLSHPAPTYPTMSSSTRLGGRVAGDHLGGEDGGGQEDGGGEENDHDSQVIAYDRLMDEYRRKRLVEFLDSMELELKEARGGLLWNQCSKNEERRKKKGRNGGSSGGSRRKTNEKAGHSSDASSGNSPGVWLGTVHQSKGLEWYEIISCVLILFRTMKC